MNEIGCDFIYHLLKSHEAKNFSHLYIEGRGWGAIFAPLST